MGIKGLFSSARRRAAVVVAAVVGAASVVRADPVAVAVPTSMDPGTVINSAFASIGTYIGGLITAIVVVSVVIAVIRFFRRTPGRVAR